MSFRMLGCCSTVGTGTCAGAPSNAEIVIVDADIHDVPAAANPYPSGIYAKGSNPIVKINGLTHGFPDDIDMLLLAPNGAYCMLMSDCGGGNSLTGIDLVIDGASATPLPNLATITSGTYKPTNNTVLKDPMPSPIGTPAANWPTDLSALSGEGIWKLYVADDAHQECGWIVSWQLVFGSTTYGDSFDAGSVCNWEDPP